MNELPEALLFTLSESCALATQIAGQAHVRLAPLEERSFEGGEFKLRPLVPVRDRAVFVVQSLAGSDDAPVANRLIRLLFLLFGLRDAGASRVTALIPYLSFARKDRRSHPRDPVNTRYIAQLIEATGSHRLIALDVHNPAALDNAFRIPVDHLSAIPMFVDHFATPRPAAGIAVASPDVGGIKRAQIFRELLALRTGQDVELVFMEKRRTSGVVSGDRLVGQVQGREVILLDDLCATGGTLVRAATAIREAGARAVHVAVTHAPMSQGLEAVAASDAVSRVVLTDSVGADLQRSYATHGKVCILPVAPLFGEALRRILAGTPLAPLLQSWPVPGPP